MKTIKKLFLGIVLCTLVFALTSCFVEDTTSLKITKLPSTSFMQTGKEETNIPELMRIEVTSGGQTTEVRLSIVKGELEVSDSRFNIELKDFSLEEVGSFTASVNYSGVTSYFDYQVIASESKFAGGDGSLNNPYQIATVEHFLNMNSVATKDKYFKLLNDISLADVEPVNDVNPEFKAGYVFDFEGILDGCGKKVFNVVDYCVFVNVTNGTIKNLDFVCTNTSAILCVTGVTKLEKVNVYGFYETVNNASPFISYPGIYQYKQGDDYYETSTEKAKTELTMIDCNNYMDIVGQGHKVSAFLAFTYYGLEKLTMTNCHNYGHIEATQVGFVTANSLNKNTFGNEIVLNMSKCSNEGKMVQISEKYADQPIAATGVTPIKYQHPTETELNATKQVVKSLCTVIGDANADSKFAKLVIDETSKGYVLSLNNDSTEKLDVSYVVVSLTFPVKHPGSTNRPAANSQKLYFDENGQINLGLSSESYERVNATASEIGGEQLFGTQNWLYVDGNKLIFVTDNYAKNGESGWEFNTEAPYFVIYAYNAAGELVAGSPEIKLTVK